jgi:mycothiol synthase
VADVPLDRIALLAAAAEEADGAAPLDEATWFALRHPDRHDVRQWTDEFGFAAVTDRTLSLVVHPDARGHGLGTSLLETALEATGGPVLEAWSHADHPAARKLAERHGFERVRELWVMRRKLADPLPDIVVPDDVVLRSYRATDAEELLRVNRLAFADHPEQGAMDAANLAVRMAEPWFDPEGLVLAERGDRLVGFHWTKQHSDRLGEVYVVGIDPTVQGIGLGRIVTVAGLEHLRSKGVEDVLLYVESDNGPAINIYRDKLGFTHADRDTHVMYRRERPPG